MISIKHFPQHFIEKWQRIADLLAVNLGLPAALILKVNQDVMEVMISSHSENNPYHVGDKEQWSGLYCQEVIQTQKELLVPNALKSARWKNNPDLKRLMIAYYGLPINYPDGKPFGTICVLDNVEKHFSDVQKMLLHQFKNVVELDIALIHSLEITTATTDADLIHQLMNQNKQLKLEHEALRKSNERYKLAMKASNDGFIDWDIEKDTFNISASMKRLLGYADHEFADEYARLEQMIHQDDKKAFSEHVEQLLQNVTERFDLVIRMHHKNGHFCWIQARWIALCDPQGKSLRIAGSHTDITKLKEDAQVLKASEEKIRVLAENASDSVLLLEGDTMTYASQRFCDYFGIKQEEACHITIPLLLSKVHPDDVPHYVQEMQRSQEQQKERYSVTFRMLNPEGNYDWIQNNVTATYDHSGKPIRRIIQARDITDTISLEHELNQSMQKYRMLAENITDVIWTVNVTKRTFTYISPSVTHLTGLTVEEAMNQRLEEILAPDSAKIIHDELSVLMPILMKGHDTKLSRTYELQQRGKNGRFIWIEVVAQWHHSPTGDIEILGVSRNIDERKEAEKQLKDSQLRWKFALEGSKDGVWDWNIETNIVYFSPQWKAMLGYGEDELNDELDEWKKRVHPDDLDKCLSDIGDHLNGVTDAYTNIHRLLCKDNSYKWVLDRGMITERKGDGKPVHIIGTHTDLTERMEMENTLRKLNADKDQFIRILGHDLRSPFNALIGFSDLLIENLDQFDRQQIEKQLRIIHQTSVSTFNLLDQILLWSKSQSGNLVLNIEKFGFVNAVQEVLNTVEKVATQKNIQTVIVDPNDSIITADMNIFRTVLRNLIINAIKFTHTNGRIVISAKKESDRIVTTVMDNGVGIEPSQMATLWDVNSNSTTNGTGGESGTGFGLKLCKELVERHGGHIWVESVAGKGSEFFFTLQSSRRKQR